MRREAVLRDGSRYKEIRAAERAWTFSQAGRNAAKGGVP